MVFIYQCPEKNRKGKQYRHWILFCKLQIWTLEGEVLCAYLVFSAYFLLNFHFFVHTYVIETSQSSYPTCKFKIYTTPFLNSHNIELLLSECLAPQTRLTGIGFSSVTGFKPSRLVFSFPFYHLGSYHSTYFMSYFDNPLNNHSASNFIFILFHTSPAAAQITFENNPSMIYSFCHSFLLSLVSDSPLVELALLISIQPTILLWPALN
jgi:hypothetical protein